MPASTPPPSATPPTQYRIAPLDAHAHLFEVRVTVDAPDPSGQAFALPVWIPGSYLIREFARHFVAVRAEVGGGRGRRRARRRRTSGARRRARDR